MKPDIRIGWATLLFLAALALSMALSAVVHADAPTLADRIERLVPSLASRKDEPVDARELAEAIASASKGDRGWAALLLTTAASESALSARIARGDCLTHECDHGRAWSLYQIQANSQNAGVWGSPDIAVQTSEALRMLRQAAARCHAFRSVPRATCIVRAYAGRQIDMPLRGEEKRLAMLQRVMRAL